MRNGAFDYLQKPFKREDLLLAVKRGLAQRKLEQEVTALRQRLEELGETDTIQSRSPAMQEQLEKSAARRRHRRDHHDSGGKRHRQGSDGALHPRS